MDQGPPVNLLSPAQLRLVARMRTVRPAADVRWTGDERGWLVELVIPDGGGRVVYSARLHRTGEISDARNAL
jgi:hypothetical protein